MVSNAKDGSTALRLRFCVVISLLLWETSRKALLSHRPQHAALRQQMSNNSASRCYSVAVTHDDDWSARMAQLVAREVRRYREARQPRMSTQQLADRTAELGMLIPR